MPGTVHGLTEVLKKLVLFNIPMSQMRKLRLRETIQLAYGHKDIIGI